MTQERDSVGKKEERMAWHMIAVLLLHDCAHWQLGRGSSIGVEQKDAETIEPNVPGMAK